MNKLKMAIAKLVFGNDLNFQNMSDAAKSSGGKRELASTVVKKIGFKSGEDEDFEEPEFSLEDIENGYNTDSYIRQGVDKYVDQIFKEGYTIYGKDQNAVDYIKLRLEYIAEATKCPTGQFLTEIIEDFVKYGNAYVIKSRNADPLALPPGVQAMGLEDNDPIVAYFPLDPKTVTVKRDKHGTIKNWQQEADSGDTKKFKPDDIVHFYYKRGRGKAYGTSFLVPVLDDVRALRQAEENCLRMMYRNIYPFFHYQVGTEETPGSDQEVDLVRASVTDMDVEAGIVTTERVNVKPIASNQVIEASPYLSYLEQRVFSGLGIPGIMFGRGNTSNRSTGDNMTSEMADRIRSITKTVELLFNEFIIKELLMEGGYDPVLNPETKVELHFHDNDIDAKVKKENQAIYKYEHNAISENEMRAELGLDPVEEAEREFMFLNNITLKSVISKQKDEKDGEKETGTKETNNKVKPSNTKKDKGTKPRPSKDRYQTSVTYGLILDACEEYLKETEPNPDRFISDISDIISEQVNRSLSEEEQKEISDATAQFCRQSQLHTEDDEFLYDADKLCENYAKTVLNRINLEKEKAGA